MLIWRTSGNARQGDCLRPTIGEKGQITDGIEGRRIVHGIDPQRKAFTACTAVRISDRNSNTHVAELVRGRNEGHGPIGATSRELNILVGNNGRVGGAGGDDQTARWTLDVLDREGDRIARRVLV